MGLNIPQALLDYVKSYPSLPIKPGQVALDNMAPTGPAISVQINPGQRVKAFIDGTEIWKQPFTVYYRAMATQSNEEKAGMLSFLNDLGDWMKKKPPEIEGLEIIGAVKASQVGLANISDQDQSIIRYSATYQFSYEK
jgi:hypothetical protein